MKKMWKIRRAMRSFSFEKYVNCLSRFPLKNVYGLLKKAITGLKSLWSFAVKNPARMGGVSGWATFRTLNGLV